MKRTSVAIAAAATIGCLFVACGGNSESESSPSASAADAGETGKRETAQGLVYVSQGTLIRNVIVVDTRNGFLLPGQSIAIDQGRITHVKPTGLIIATGSTKVVDAAGKYVVPGYNDMHTHVVPMAAFMNAPAWPLLIANGVTGVRDMAGAPPLIAAAQQYNAARAAGTLDSPEVLQIPGPVVAGAFTAASGVQAVQQTKAMGGAFVKVVNAFPDAMNAIISESKAQGLEISGHLSPGLSAVAAVNAGWKSFEHLGAEFGIQLDCASDQAAIRQALLTGQGAHPPSPLPPTYTVSPFLYSAGDAPWIQREINSYNASTCTSVARTVAQSNTWQVPTMIRLRTMLQSDNAEFRDDPNLRYVDTTTKAMWNQLATEFTNLQPSSAATTFRSFNASFVNMLKLLRQQGGASKIVTGTDIGGIWVIPGFSLHQEFRELANAGFTPLEVLQATTLNSAKFLKRETTMGTVEAGKNADLVLLDANPVLAVGNLAKIAGVVNGGKYFSKADLDAIKAGVANAAVASPLRAFSTVIDTSHTH